MAEKVTLIDNAMNVTLEAARRAAEQDRAALAQAEAAIQGLLERFGACATGLQDSAQLLQDENRGIQSEISEVLVSLQFQDRVSQILGQVRNDVQKLVQRASDPAAQGAAMDASAWLDEMQGTYAMAEQRENHTGAALSAPAAAGVTFF